MKESIIDRIREDYPLYDPLTPALEKAGVSKELWEGATQRIYTDGMYGPIHPIEWAEQDGREPYIVSDAIKIVAKVLEEVDEYRDEWGDEVIIYPAEDIRADLVFWYREIYGVRYPTL